MSKRRVHVIDDEEPIRRSSKLMLSVLGYEVATFATGTAFIDSLAGLAPGAVLLDIRMPEIDGLEVQQILNERGFGLPVVVMSGHGDLSLAVPAMRNGAIAFLEKPFPRERIQKALEIAFLMLEDEAGFADYLQHVRGKLERLGETERSVLALLAAGRSNDAIAEALGLSGGAIDVCRARMFGQLGIDSVTEALRLAYAGGLVSDTD